MATHITLNVQQPQTATYNHPLADLYDGGRRREYIKISVPLYRASIEGDLKAAEAILQEDENLVRCSITDKKETPLHVAAAGYSAMFVSYLVDRMELADLELKNRDGNTAFCIAVISGKVDMVEIMLMKNPALQTICGSGNMTPLYLAADSGYYNMVNFLYGVADKMRVDVWTNDVMDGVLLKCMEAGMLVISLQILEDYKELPQDKHAWDMLWVLAVKPEVFPVRSPTIIGQIYSLLTRSGLIKQVPLLKLLWRRIMEKPKDVIDKILRGPVLKVYNTETYPSQILFVAAKMNNVMFLVKLIREYPDLIWKINDDGQTIFHVAVANRHYDVFSLLYEIGSMNNKIAAITDEQGNNILHLVGKNPKKNAYKDGVTTPFQMYNEFLWYQEVEGILPPSCRSVTNADGKTPKELFTENHEKLVSDGLKSINETINISMVVAALVCTVGFSVVFQIPGGFDKNGFPMLHKHNGFFPFMLSDTLSFLCATVSIIIFLSVILSGQHGDMVFFYARWAYGQLALLASVSFAVNAFIYGFFLLYPKTNWTHLMNGFVYLIMGLNAAVFMSIIDGKVTLKGLFRPRRQRLYRKNPKV